MFKLAEFRISGEFGNFEVGSGLWLGGDSASNSLDFCKFFLFSEMRKGGRDKGERRKEGRRDKG